MMNDERNTYEWARFRAIATTPARTAFIEVQDSAGMQRFRDHHGNRNLWISTWRSSGPDSTSPRLHGLYIRTELDEPETVRTRASEVCRYLEEVCGMPPECVDVLYDGHNVHDMSEEIDEGDLLDSDNGCIRAPVSGIHGLAEMTIVVDPIVFGGRPTPLMPLLNQRLARQLKDDGIEIDIDAYSQEQQFVPLFNSVDATTDNVFIRLRPEELLNIDAEGIFRLASAPRPDDVGAEQRCAPEATEWFGKALQETESFTKKQSQLQQVLHQRGWLIPPCIRRTDWADMTREQAIEACRVTSQYYSLIGAGEAEVHERIRRMDRRNGIQDYLRLRSIVNSGREYPAFVGCDHPLLHGFCPAGGCPMTELLDESTNPLLFT